MQLHHNAGRDIPYLPLAQSGAASSSSTIAMRVQTRIDLDGSALNNVRGNLYPIDVDGDRRFEFVHFNGYRYMRVYDQSGRKLWQIDNASGRVHRDTIHRDTLAVLDADGDGKQEIAHCWVSGGRKQLVLRSGRTGAVLHAVNLDASSGTECQIAAFRVSSRSKPIILVAETNKSGCAKSGNYIDTWARTVAFDTNLTRLWDRNTCNAGHYAYPVDGNGDGLAGSIFIGRHLYDAYGNRICSVDLGGTHADSVAVGDLDPGRTGLEAVLTGANGTKAVSTADKCATLWTVPNSVINNPQHATLARLDPGSSVPTVVIHQKGTVSNAAVYFLDGKGRILAHYPKSSVNSQMPFQNANLDGAKGTDELMIFNGRVLDRNGKIRLSTAWYWNLTGSKVRTIKPPTSFDTWSPYPLVMDLDQDHRDEIVTWGQSLIVIGKSY